MPLLFQRLLFYLFRRQTNPWFGGYKGREGYDTIYRNKCGKNWVGLRTLLLGAAG